MCRTRRHEGRRIEQQGRGDDDKDQRTEQNQVGAAGLVAQRQGEDRHTAEDDGHIHDDDGPVAARGKEQPPEQAHHDHHHARQHAHPALAALADQSQVCTMPEFANASAEAGE